MEIKIIQSDGKDLDILYEKLGSRSKLERGDVVSTVSKIIKDVRTRGDEAVCDYTAKFDGVNLKPEMLKVKESEIKEAMQTIDPKLLEVLKKAYKNILEFHLAQKSNDVCVKRGNDSYVKLLSRPLDKVGIYVPGGTAPLPSSVLMNIAPAKAAGVNRIIMCTPPLKSGGVDPVILASAKIAGADEIYKIGGAQAIAAMAYGTNTVPCVDKICGPGNIYVNMAKKLVFGNVDIDMFAGPSEILILGDKTANPKFLAADLLSQAEHDKLASAILITDNKKIAEETAKFVKNMACGSPRADILKASLKNYCAIVIVPNMNIGVEFANALAPEHLELCVKNPEEMVQKIKNAGAIFLGNYTPESVGDYYAGSNHVLPTSGTARFFSALNTDDFRKKISVIKYSEDDLKMCAEDVALFARAESLECHAQAVLVRMDNDNRQKEINQR